MIKCRNRNTLFIKCRQVFTLIQQQEVPGIYVSRNLHHIHRPPSRELVYNKSSLQYFYVNNRRHITDIRVSHLYLPSPSLEEHHTRSSPFKSSAPLSPRLQGQEGIQNLTTMTCWNEIILDEIIEYHVLKSRELRVHIPRRVGASGRTSPLTTP